MELILSRLTGSARVGVIVEPSLPLERIEAMALPDVEISKVVTDGESDARKAVFELIRLYLKMRPNVVLANTHQSARPLASAARILPELHQRAFIYVRDFLWTALDTVFQALPNANILVPHEIVLERPAYLADVIKRSPGRQVFVVPDMVDIPSGAEPAGENGAPLLHLATVNPWKGPFAPDRGHADRRGARTGGARAVTRMDRGHVSPESVESSN
jgi:hypothetical protein